MIPLGNLLLVAASVLLVALGRLQLSAMPGGDRGVGFAFALLWGHGAMVLLMLGVTAVLAIAGRLPAAPVAAGWQVPAALAFVGLCTLIAAATAAAAPSGAPQPWSLDAALRLAPLLVPLLLMLCAALLLNSAAPGSRDVVRRSLQAVTLLTGAMALVGMAPIMASKVRAWTIIATRDRSALDSNEQRILSQVESSDPSQQFVSLLGYARGGNHPKIRARAVEKLQSVAGWEQRVIETLAGPSAPEAFTFLAANEVPDRKIFAEPIATGIEQQALQVRERIRRASHPSHLYPGLMIFEVEALLKTLDKFATLGTDYAPALQQLRDAFSEPSGYTHPEYRAVQAIDRWLKKRR